MTLTAEEGRSLLKWMCQADPASGSKLFLLSKCVERWSTSIDAVRSDLEDKLTDEQLLRYQQILMQHHMDERSLKVITSEMYDIWLIRLDALTRARCVLKVVT